MPEDNRKPLGLLATKGLCAGTQWAKRRPFLIAACCSPRQLDFMNGLFHKALGFGGVALHVVVVCFLGSRHLVYGLLDVLLGRRKVWMRSGDAACDKDHEQEADSQFVQG